MKKILVLLAALFTATFAFCQQVTITGHPITGQNATPSGGVSILWELANDNSQQCKINGTGIIVPTPFSVTPAQLAAGIQIIPNNVIVCGSSLGLSRWRYTIKAAGIGTRQCPLNIVANTNLDSAVCLNASATPTTTVPAANLFLLLNGANSLTGDFLPSANGTQAIGSSGLRWNMFANTANIVNLTVTGTCTGCGGGGSTPTGTGFAHITAGVQDGTAKTVDVSSADTTGVLKAASFPALTGDLTTPGGSLATTLATVATPGTGLKTTVNAKGLVTSVGPAACADLSNGAASCSTDTTNAANISSGTLLAARMPAYTGDVTSTVNTTVTTLATVATPATATKVTFNAKGLVTSSGTTDVSSADITGVLKAASFPALTGDVTTAAGALASTIAAGAVTRAKEAADGKGWQSLGTPVTGATTTVGPLVWTAACRELQFHYIIKGYNGGTPIGRFLLGVGSISTTALTNGSNLSQNFAAPTSAPSIPGIPLATATTNIQREGWIHVYGASGDLKNINIQGQEGTPSVSSPPAIFIAAGAFSDLGTNLPLLRAQLTVYDTLIATAASAQTFNSGTILEGWCRNGD